MERSEVPSAVAQAMDDRVLEENRFNSGGKRKFELRDYRKVDNFEGRGVTAYIGWGQTVDENGEDIGAFEVVADTDKQGNVTRTRIRGSNQTGETMTY